TGTGSYAGDVTFAGGFNPGNGTAQVHLANFNLAPTNTLTLDFGGVVPNDELLYTGAATLGGILSVHFATGFAPHVGHTFVVMPGRAASALTGTFATLQAPAGYQYSLGRVSQNYVLTFTAVPEPGTLVLAAAAAAPLAVAVRRLR